MHILSTVFVVHIPAGAIIFDAFIHALVFAALGFLLYRVFLYGNYNVLSPVQKYSTYTALGTITVILWLGICYGLIYLFFPNTVSGNLAVLIPQRAFTGILMYIILVLLFKEYDKTDEETEPDEEITEARQEENPQELIDRITVKTGQKIHIINVEAIIYIQSYGDYIQLITNEGKYTKEQTMKYYESHLPNNRFVRIHRSYIVNVEHISRIELHTKQTQMITLKNGTQLKASATGYKLLKSTLEL